MEIDFKNFTIKNYKINILNKEITVNDCWDHFERGGHTTLDSKFFLENISKFNFFITSNEKPKILFYVEEGRIIYS
jgi:hypothetical protein